ncbi:unnamed protein product, partial [Discosporangium mesarthrocarpum]
MYKNGRRDLLPGREVVSGSEVALQLASMATRLEYDELFKIVLVGDTAVGKTNLLAYYTSQDKRLRADGSVPSFSANRKTTVGVEFAAMIVTHPDGKRIKAQIWDTAGQERYRAITSSHYKRAAGALLVFDATSRKSFENATKVWLPELKNSAETFGTLLDCIVLVGNKIDLPNVGVSETEQQVTARRTGISTISRTSAKTGKDVDKTFEQLILRIYDIHKAKRERG